MSSTGKIETDGCHPSYHELGVHAPGVQPEAAPEPERQPTLGDMALEVFEVNRANGWFEDDRTIGEDLALLHSEVSETLEAYRDHGFEDVTKPMLGDPNVLPKPEGVGSELADVLIRLLDTCHRRTQQSEWWSKSLAEVAAGEWPNTIDTDATFGDALAELHRVIALGELSTLLIDLLVVARMAGVDLSAEYARKIAYNRVRGYRHGGKRL